MLVQWPGLWADKVPLNTPKFREIKLFCLIENFISYEVDKFFKKMFLFAWENVGIRKASVN